MTLTPVPVVWSSRVFSDADKKRALALLGPLTRMPHTHAITDETGARIVEVEKRAAHDAWAYVTAPLKTPVNESRLNPRDRAPVVRDLMQEKRRRAG